MGEKRRCTCRCDWVTSLYSRKLSEHRKPAIIEKIKIIIKLKKKKSTRSSGSFLWCSGLRIQCCHCCGFWAAVVTWVSFLAGELPRAVNSQKTVLGGMLPCLHGGTISSRGLEGDTQTVGGIQCEADPSRGNPPAWAATVHSVCRTPGTQAVAQGKGLSPTYSMKANPAAPGLILAGQ